MKKLSLHLILAAGAALTLASCNAPGFAPRPPGSPPAVEVTMEATTTVRH